MSVKLQPIKIKIWRPKIINLRKKYLTRNICIINVDIYSCLEKFYNDGILELSSLEKFGAILKTDYLEDVSDITKGLIDMKEKKNF